MQASHRPATIVPMTTTTPPAAPLLELDHVSRRRGGRPAVEDLCLTLTRGDITGLLGVNGAGKSTTLAMMAGVLAPDRGQVRVEGQDLAEYPEAVRRRIGWLPERAPLYEELTVAEQLDAMARLHGLARSDRQARREAMLESLQLESLARRLIGQLSQGQRQRVGLACALIHDPPILLLDEPLNGLDPVQVERWRQLLHELAAEHAVLVSTHVLDDVTTSCNRVAVLHEGRLRHSGVLSGDTRALQEQFMAIAISHEREAA